MLGRASGYSCQQSLLLWLLIRSREEGPAGSADVDINININMAMRMPEGKGTYFGQNIATKYSKLEKKSKQTYVVLFIIAAVVTEVALHHTHDEYLISFT